MDDNEKSSATIKKQKPGLNAIRPVEYVEMKFKSMAKDKDISQTALFESMFWNYINDEKNNKKESVISFDSEVNLISKSLENILQQFKTIIDRSQSTVISYKENVAQIKTNLDLNIETLKNEIIELKTRNAELEKSNNAFDGIKTLLESNIVNLKAELSSNVIENKKLKENLKTDETLIKDLNRNIEINIKENRSLKHEVSDLNEASVVQQSKIKNLEISNDSLHATLSTLEVLKKAEISSIEAKYQAIISDHEAKLNNLESSHSKDLQKLENQIKKECEYDKIMAIADIKLSLAETKEKYNQLLISTLVSVEKK